MSTNKNTSFNSSYWLPSTYDLFKSSKKLTEYDYVMYLNSISNFVNILVGNDKIKVKYCVDNKSIQSANDNDDNCITINADLNTPHKFDVTVGMTLREAGHILLTDNTLFKKYTQYLTLHGDIELFNNTIPTKNELDYFTTLFNIVEDLRVYNYILNKCPGYIGYYNAMLDDYFNDTNVSMIINNEKIELPEQLWDNYIFNITNIRNPLIVNVLDCLPNLSKIYTLLSEDNINKLQSSTDSIALVKHIYKLINSVAIKHNDIDNSKVKEITRTIKYVAAKQNDYVNGAIYSHKKSLNTKKYNAINNIAGQNNINIIESQFIDQDSHLINVPCIVVRGFDNINDELNIHQPISNCIAYKSAILQGITYGNILSSKLKTYTDVTPLTIYGVKYGQISEQLLYSCEYNDNIFQYDTIVNIPKQYIHISLDASGSMEGVRWANTIQCAVAIAKATQYINSIHTVISIRTSMKNNDMYIPKLHIIYDSHTDNIDTLIDDISYIKPIGYTPEGLCINSILDNIISSSENKKSFFINFSDGIPCIPIYNPVNKSTIQYDVKLGVAHTKQMIDKLRQHNINILSFLITDDYDINEYTNEIYCFKQMYGKDSRYINVNDINLLTNELNNLFIKNND